MSLPLVAEEACGGGELHTNANLLVAAEGLQVRVHVFARLCQEGALASGGKLLTRSCISVVLAYGYIRACLH